jgi:hypothetical protein
MVRAILDGQKTQTRRVVKYIPDLGEPENWCCDNIDDEFFIRLAGDYRRYCPYGIPGDRLWVRETWTPHEKPSGHVGILYRADGSFVGIKNTKEAVDDWLKVWDGAREHKWRPSIHMPRWASRITLEVKGVRAERLQDITEADSQDEGIIPSIVVQKYRSGFQTLWDSINKKRGYGWDTNPWVWAVEFMMI